MYYILYNCLYLHKNVNNNYVNAFVTKSVVNYLTLNSSLTSVLNPPVNYADVIV